MRTPSWNRKCRSRLEVMDTGQTPVTESLIKMCSCSWKASWIPFNQQVCFQDKCPTSTILQLETRPSSCNSKCSLNLLEGSSPVHIPTICPHSSLSEQAPGGGDSNLDYPSVAQSDLVPTVTQELDRPTNRFSSHSEHCDQPRERKPPNGNEGLAFSGHLHGLSQKILPTQKGFQIEL